MGSMSIFSEWYDNLQIKIILIRLIKDYNIRLTGLIAIIIKNYKGWNNSNHFVG
jgi:hypothetical protein